MVSFRNEDDEAARKRKTAEADSLFKAVCADEEAASLVINTRLIVSSQLALRKSMHASVLRREKEAMPHLRATPGASFVESTPGFGWVGLLLIVGEAGDLSNYANPGKLWRRFGLAPMSGKAMSTWGKSKQLTAEDWTAAGYSPRRRSLMWTIGDSLSKCKGPYREIYLARKEFEAQKFATQGLPVLGADEAKKLKAKPGEYATKMHVDIRAKRYMEKRLLRDLWRAWRGLPPHTGEESIPAAT